MKKGTGYPREGSALVIVLASLAFMTALALAFVASIGTELKSSKRYADGMTVQLLAGSSYSLVQSRIQEATKGYSGNSPSSSAPVIAWASQPGMIRTYDDKGKMVNYYRLYSWNELTGSSPFKPSDDLGEMAQWASKTALFTDLNEPIKTGGEELYPIVDANAATLKANIKNSTGATTVSGKTYDADGDGKWDIEGFSVNTPPASSSTNLVPMPVKWLYVLANGDIKGAAAVSGNDKQVKVADATRDNPIVGRIAFWTDDDTSKININTASEGVYWDTPRVKSKQDDVFKVNQPVGGEYQRYPGHPAMTSLSTVIKHPSGWDPGTSVPTFTGGSADAVKFTLCTPAEWIDYQWAQKIYGIVPRVGTGGSNAGSVQTAMLAVAPPTMTLDADRLYTSVDELAFKTNRTSNNIELANQVVLTKATLERSKFFLTASSRAPDVNLFNQPRVCIWPIHNTATDVYRTAFDRLIARCTTLGGYTYYFERLDPSSPTADLALNRNDKILAYLRNLANKEIPGFGGSFNGKYPSDRDQILTEIFDYVRSTNLRDAALVKTPESSSTSYTKGITNSAPGSAWSGFIGSGQVVPIVDSATSTRGFGRFPTVQGASVLFFGQVDGDDLRVPRIASTHASNPTYPNYPGSSTPYPASTSQVDPVSGKPLPIYSNSTPSATIVTPAVAPGYMRMQAVFLPQFFCPSVGSVWMLPNFQWSVDLSNLKVNNFSMGFPAETKFVQNKTSLDETGFGDQYGIRQVLQVASSGLVSVPMDVPKGTFTFGGKVTIKIWASDPVASPSPSTKLLQTIVLNFNGPACAVPSLAYDHVANKNGIGVGNYDLPNAGTQGSPNYGIYFVNYRAYSSGILTSGRYNNQDPDNPIYQSPTLANPVTNSPVPASNQGGRLQGILSTRGAQGFIIPTDSIRSVRVASGDARMVAAQISPDENLFESNPTLDKLMGAHNFFTGYGQPYYGAGMGKLAKDLAYFSSASYTGNLQLSTDVVSNVFGFQGYSPASDTGLNGVAAGSNSAIGSNGIQGDFDNGPFAVRDGPFINKADEGDKGNTDAEPYNWASKAASSGSIPAALFSPNRQVPSAVTFGSLPTGIKSNKPWQTLLFRPMPGHPGSGLPLNDPVGPPYTTPPDHLLLDLFTMPVVEPYAISEPLSTAGRINMNYQIVPFTFIRRETGIRALLKAEKVASIRDDQVGVYKVNKYTGSPNPIQASIRMDVNPEETLKGFDQRFAANDIFRSASEICDLHIVPIDANSSKATYADMKAYWDTHRLTGDNTKERIYATLYPRLTTKSNTFTVYTRVQTLKKVGGDPDVWTENLDQVTGQYRGSQTVERFVDPNQSGIPDYTGGNGVPVSTFYKMRVLATKQFAP